MQGNMQFRRLFRRSSDQIFVAMQLLISSTMLFKKHQKMRRISNSVIKQISNKVISFIFKLKQEDNLLQQSGITLLTILFLQPNLFSFTVHEVQTAAVTIKRLNNCPTNKSNCNYKSTTVAIGIKQKND